MSLITKEAFAKSLARLEQMNVSKAQLFHTGSDSTPGTWAGTTPEEAGSDADGIVDENGTDAGQVSKALAAKVAKGVSLTDAETAISKGQNPLKFISAKIAKGQALTPVESWAVKGGMPMFAGGKNGLPMTKATSEDIQSGETSEATDGDAAKAKVAAKVFDKSLEAQVAKSETMSKALQVSPFLYEFAKAMGSALENTEAGVVDAVNKAVGALATRISNLEKAQNGNWDLQGQFNKSLGEAVVGLGQAATAQAEASAQVASAPARGAMSVVKGGKNSNGTIQKSFEGNSQPGGLGSLEKSQLSGVLLDLFKGGHVTEMDVIKFDSSGEVSPVTEAKVKSYLAGNLK